MADTPTDETTPTVTKGRRGGRRPGAGRPPLDGMALKSSVLVRMTESQKKRLHDLGGCRWIRAMISSSNPPDPLDATHLPGYAGKAAIEPEALSVPLAENTVQAGFPSPAENDARQDIDLNQLLVKNPASTFLLRVQGDSMIDAGIADGDLLVVDRSRVPHSGDIVIMQVNNEFTVKRYCVDKASSKPYLHAENSSGTYRDITPSDCDEWLCFGVVRYALKAF